MEEVPDMTALERLDEEAMLANLEKRLLVSSQPYTYVSTVLVAVNPLREVKGLPTAESYFDVPFDPKRPHPNALAELAYQRLLSGRSPDQSLVVSGESGAGKTETSKVMIEYLTKRTSNAATDLAKRIVAISPVLEAFGNASTHRNANSSRFGRFVKLMFESKKLSGGEMETYLLEKSRVVRQNKGERNFHSMHMASAKTDVIPKGKHRCLPDAGVMGGDDKSVPRYEEVARSLEAIRLDAKKCEAAWRVLGAVCALADVEIESSHDAGVNDTVGAIDVSSGKPLDRVAKLLDVDANSLLSALTERGVKTMQETVSVKRDPNDAAAARDSACRWIYGRLFDALVAQCNVALSVEDGKIEPSNTPNARRRFFIGILDIFGFEILSHNGLETLLINYANEALQQLFCDAVFKAELDLYEEEGIMSDEAKQIEPPNSKPTIELLVGKGPPPGILKTLDAQCATGTRMSTNSKNNLDTERDAAFLARVHKEHAKHDSFPPTSALHKRAMFHVQHYAGSVGYTVIAQDVDGWVATNVDAVPDGLSDAIAASKDPLVASLATVSTDSSNMSGAGSSSGSLSQSSAAPPKRASTRQPKTVSSRFATSMAALAQTLTSTDCGFVRCVKPTPKMVPGVFDKSYVAEQLRALGIVAATEVLRVGLPHRVEYSELLQNLPASARSALDGEPSDLVVACTLTAFDVPGDAYKLGKTRVFFPASAMARINKVLQFDEKADPAKAAQISKRLVEAKKSAQQASARLKVASKEHARATDALLKAKAALAQLDDNGDSSDDSDDEDEPQEDGAATAGADAAAAAAVAREAAATTKEATEAAAKIKGNYDEDLRIAKEKSAAAAEHAKLAQTAATAAARHAEAVASRSRSAAEARAAVVAAQTEARAATAAMDDARAAARRLELAGLDKATKVVAARADAVEQHAKKAEKCVEEASAQAEKTNEKNPAELLDDAVADAAASRADAERDAQVAMEAANVVLEIVKVERARLDEEARIKREQEEKAKREQQEKAASATAAAAATATAAASATATAAAAASASPETDDGLPSLAAQQKEAKKTLRERVRKSMSKGKKTESPRPLSNAERKEEAKRVLSNLRTFKKWFVLELVGEADPERKLPAPKSQRYLGKSQSELAMPSLPPSKHHASLRDMEYRGLFSTPSDPESTDPRLALLHCIVKRRKGVTVSHQFELYLSSDPETLILSARRASTSSAAYHLYDEQNKRKVVARIKDYPLVESASKLAIVELAIFGHQRALRGGAPREIGVVMGPKSDCVDRIEEEESSPLRTVLSAADSVPPGHRVFVQRDPSKKDGRYSLDFRGRGKVASVKNFQLVGAAAPPEIQLRRQGEPVLQFCKVSSNRFHLDFAPPFSPLTAFSLAVSTCLT